MRPAGYKKEIFLVCRLALIRLSADMIQMKIIFTVERHTSTAVPCQVWGEESVLK